MVLLVEMILRYICYLKSWLGFVVVCLVPCDTRAGFCRGGGVGLYVLACSRLDLLQVRCVGSSLELLFYIYYAIYGYTYHF